MIGEFVFDLFGEVTCRAVLHNNAIVFLFHKVAIIEFHYMLVFQCFEVIYLSPDESDYFLCEISVKFFDGHVIPLEGFGFPNNAI